jgi:hypothetical protein
MQLQHPQARGQENESKRAWHVTERLKCVELAPVLDRAHPCESADAAVAFQRLRTAGGL